MPSGTTTVTAGHATTIRFGVAPAGDRSTTIRWQAQPGPGGLAVSPSSGTFTVGRPESGPGHSSRCGAPTPVTAALSVAAPASASGPSSIRITLQTANDVALPPVVVDVVTNH
jgi:hypothetical protein